MELGESIDQRPLDGSKLLRLLANSISQRPPDDGKLCYMLAETSCFVLARINVWQAVESPKRQLLCGSSGCHYSAEGIQLRVQRLYVRREGLREASNSLG